MKNTLSIGLLSLFLLLFLSACEGDPSTLLTDGMWDFENISTDSEDEQLIVIVTSWKAALTDGYMEFNEDGTFLMDAPLLDEAVSGTWSLVGEDQLVLNSNLGPETANIESLSKKELKYIETWYYDQQTAFSVTFSWSRD